MNGYPTAEEMELIRICPALEIASKLALSELKAEADQLLELFYDTDKTGKLVDVYVKLKDGRTAIGSALIHPRGRH